jgi:hypothetical protein
LERIFKVLAVAALMVVLMATTVSPTFAQPQGTESGGGFKNGVAHGGQDPEPGAEGWCAYKGKYNTYYYCENNPEHKPRG